MLLGSGPHLGHLMFVLMIPCRPVLPIFWTAALVISIPFAPLRGILLVLKIRS